MRHSNQSATNSNCHSLRRTCAKVIVIAMCMTIVTTARIAVAQIEIDTDFATASLQSFELYRGEIRLWGETTWTRYPDTYGWIYFRASSVNGSQPKFRIQDGPGNFNNNSLLGHKMVYSYDQQTWHQFDVVEMASTDLRFFKTSPFSEDEVYIASSIPYPVKRTIETVERWGKSPFVNPTSSANNDFVIGTVPNTTPYGPADLPLYGLEITNAASTKPKQHFVLATGNHGSEMSGDYTLEGTIDFLLSDDPRAVAIRDHARVFVYPQVNPLGRMEGFYRGNSQNPAVDHNRAWNENAAPDHFGLREVGILRYAILQDTLDPSLHLTNRIDMMLDFHGFYGPDNFEGQTGQNFLLSDPDADFASTMAMLEPDMQLFPMEAALTPEAYTMTFSAQFGALQTFIPETRADRSIDEYHRLGRSYGIALSRLIVPEPNTVMLCAVAFALTTSLRRRSTW